MDHFYERFKFLLFQVNSTVKFKRQLVQISILNKWISIIDGKLEVNKTWFTGEKSRWPKTSIGLSRNQYNASGKIQL